VLAICFSACTQIEETGTAAPEIKIERKAFVEQNYSNASAMDCTEIVKFIGDMNTRLDEEFRISDYEMYYDKETSTVFVTSSTSTLAFKVDESGNILFSSCTGPQETKSIISQGIAKTYNSTFSNSVEDLFSTVESARWLNSLNSSYIDSAVSGFSMRDLDTTLSASMPEVPEMELYDGFPTITEAISRTRRMDLEDYFESPTLDKFWSDVDASSIQSEMDANTQIGSSIKDYFNNTTIEAPEVDRPTDSSSSGAFSGTGSSINSSDSSVGSAISATTGENE